MASAVVSAISDTAVRYRTANVDGVDVFYREAGAADAPAVVLLHGYPSSSAMFRNLIPQLAAEYHVIAPDYPGFGQSAMPDRAAFDYTFAHLAEVVEQLLEKLGVARYALYVMDYGAPVGYRLALRHPARVTALVIQNGNAYEEGLREFWAPLRRLWADPSEENRDALRPFLTLAGTTWQYAHNNGDLAALTPDAWVLDQAYLDRPGNAEIQLDLFYDYRTNIALYPQIQQYFRQYQPPALIVWGKNDSIFPAEGAMPYLRDLPDAEMHLLDAGHFALESKGDEIAAKMLEFLGRTLVS
ncbi:MAG: alpha/beta hydrolase [Acidobacteriota bacterium]